MRKASYTKSIQLPPNEELERMNYEQVSKILDKLIQVEDDEGFLVKPNSIPTSITIIDCDFRGGDKRSKGK